MEVNNLKDSNNTKNDDSLKATIQSIRKWTLYLVSKWYVILIFTLIGVTLGLLFSISKSTTYIAKTSFVLESNENSGMGQYAGIASMFGVDLGNASGIFQGENILELYKSRRMIQKTLLSPITDSGISKELLIDRFIEFNRLKEKWNGKNSALKNISFREDNVYSSAKEQILHDSILQVVVRTIKNDYLTAIRPDKKLNIIEVTIKAKDEQFAKILNEQLVKNVNNLYFEVKMGKSQNNISIIQKKVDSVKAVMSGAIYRVSQIADATPNQNPTRMIQRVAPIQISQASAEVNKSILSELIKNLEVSKINLKREEPLIQIIDYPILPLEKKQYSKIRYAVIGFVTFFIIAIFILIFMGIIRTTLSS